QDGPAEKDKAFTVIGVVAFLAARQGELIQTPALSRVFTFEVFGLFDQVDRYRGARQRGLPERSGDLAIADRHGKSMFHGNEGYSAGPRTVVEGKYNRTLPTAAGQSSWQKPGDVCKAARLGKGDHFRGGQQ